MDRISEMPQPIQHHILSLLERKEVARASVLSKEWRSIAQSHPVLEFYHFQFKEIYDNKECSRFLLNHVEECMKKVVEHNRSIQRFSLWVEYVELDRWEHKLNRWMQQLVEGKINDLTLLFNMTILEERRKSARYMLTPFVSLSETITHLRLGQCDLGDCRSVSLPNLLLLSLVDVPLSRRKLKKIISGCPNLEVLRLEIHDNDLSRIHVSGLARLVEVELKMDNNVTEVKIVAPKLRVFKLREDSYVTCHTKIELLACESTLRKLKLHGLHSIENGLKNLVSKFPGLKELVLTYCFLESIEIPNQKIRKLKVCFCGRLERVDIDSTSLRVLKYCDNKLPFYSVNSSFSPNDTIDFYADFSMNLEYISQFERWIKSYNELFLKFSQFRDIKLIVKFFYTRDVIVCEEFDEKLIKMLCNMKDKEPIIEVIRSTTYEYMVDHFFASFRKCQTIYMVSRDQQRSIKFFQALSEKIQKENDESNCCRCKYNKCWKHFLYDTEMINDEMIGNPKMLESFDATKYEITCIKLHWTSTLVQYGWNGYQVVRRFS